MDPNFHVSSATFSFKFLNFSRITKLTQSPACWIQNLPWKIFIEPAIRENRKYLSIFVGCVEPITKDRWSCMASIKMYKLHGSRPRIVRTTKSLSFDSATSTSWGHVHFIPWDQVLDPLNGFIKNDSITIEVTLDAELPEGVQLTEKHFTDERAKPLLQACEESLKSLNEKIANCEALKKTQNEEIENLKKKLENFQETTENHKKDIEVEQKRLKELTEEYEEFKKNARIKTEEILKQKEAEIKLVNQKLVETEDKFKQNEASSKNLQKLTEKNQEKIKNLEEIRNSQLKEIENLKKTFEKSKGNYGEQQTKITQLMEDNRKYEEMLRFKNDENARLDKILTEKEARIVELIDNEENCKKNSKNVLSDDTNSSTSSKALNEANNKIKQLEIENSNKIKELEIEKQKLNGKINELIMKSKNQDEQKLNLTSQINSNIEKYNALKIEKENLENRMNSISGELIKFKEELKKNEEIKKELNDTKKSSKLVVQEKKKLKEDLETAQAKLQEYETKNSDHTISKLTTEKMDLQSKNREILKEMESLKNELKILEKIRKENVDLHLELNSIKNELNKLNENERINKDNVKKRTAQQNPTNLSMNLMETKEIVHKNVELTSDSSVLNDEIENLKKILGKRIKDIDVELEEQRKVFVKRLDDLQFELEVAKKEKRIFLHEKKRIDGKIKGMKNEMNIQENAKKNLLITLRDSNKSTRDSFRIVVGVMKNLREAGKISCSLEKRLEILLEKIGSDVNFPHNFPLTNDSTQLEEKLDYLEKHLENELKIVKQEYSNEKSENVKMKGALRELSDLMNYKSKLLENYKELLKITESKLDHFRVKLNELDNQLYDEKKKKNYAELECRRLSECIETQEVEIDELKKKLWNTVYENIHLENNDYDEKLNSDEKKIKTQQNLEEESSSENDVRTEIPSNSSTN